MGLNRRSFGVKNCKAYRAIEKTIYNSFKCTGAGVSSGLDYWRLPAPRQTR